MNKLIDMVTYFNGATSDLGIKQSISDNENYDYVITNINEYPHAIIFMAVIDENSKDGFPESLPYKYLSENKDFSFFALSKLNYDEFKTNMLRADYHIGKIEIDLLYDTIQTIKKDFHSNAANIWNDNPSSYILKQRLMMFAGMNVEKANILSIILVQKFNIKLADTKDINISYDWRILVAMAKIGLINDENSPYDKIKMVTRAISPNYPGIFDGFFFMLGTYIIAGRDSSVVINASKETIILDCIQAVNSLKERNLI